MSAGDAERLGLLEDEIWNATDRLSRSEAKAVVHSVYNGDWLAAHDAGVAAAARREGAAEAWDEGYDACWTDVDNGAFPGEMAPNPYRVAAAPHEEQP